jgi:uncharacterized protein with FMN-binding domain
MVNEPGRTRRVVMWFAGTAVALVLLFSYRTSTGAGTTAVAAGPARGQQAPGVVATAPPPGGSASPPATENSVVVNGTVADTRWGPVQVQVTIASGRITDAQALIYPDGNGRDQAINDYALPRLREQVLAVQSAAIDGVSGATVTSDGYRESLQAALDAAHFGQ